MSSVVVPVRMLAIAATAAAQFVGEDPSDAFDPPFSRARCIAIAAIRRALPSVSQAVIARHFGLNADAPRISAMMIQAQTSKWWSDDHVRHVMAKIFPHLACRVDDALPKGLREPRVTMEEERAVAFTPRKIDPTRIIPAPPRPKNVTAAFLGDPPPGRREQIAAIDWKGARYSFQDDGKRRPSYNRGQSHV